jgi:hypothetical protein
MSTGPLADRQICWMTLPTSCSRSSHLLSRDCPAPDVPLPVHSYQTNEGRSPDDRQFSAISTVSVAVLPRHDSGWRENGPEPEFSRQSQQNSSKNTNLKLSRPTSIFCNDRLSQQSSAALPSPVSFWFSLFLVGGFHVSQSFSSSSGTRRPTRITPFLSYLLTTIWVRLLNDLHQLLSPMLGLPRIIIRWHFL